MKKVISILLVVLVAFSALSMVSFAGSEVPGPSGRCECDEHIASPAGVCHCCILCPNIDKTYLTACAQGPDGKYDGDLCCGKCTGMFPCFCGCSCCDNEEEEPSNNPIVGKWDDIWDQDAQDDFVNGFQKILKRISDVFDSIFDAIFEFLKIDGVIGRN